MANNIFVYWSDGLRAAHLTITVGEQGFPNKNCPQGRVFDNFFQVSGVYLGGGGVLAAGIDSHITKHRNLLNNLHCIVNVLCWLMN